MKIKYNANLYLLPVMVSKTTPVGGLEVGKKPLETPAENMLHTKQWVVLELKATNMYFQLITTLVGRWTQH